jgi:hypothetical protein
MGWIMANYFVDSTTGDDGDNGTTMDLAFATVEYAVESGGLSAGDFVWIRRLHSETPGGHVQPAYNGTHENPVRLIGWPRAADASISSATWTNGSTTVDLIVGLSMDREKHLGRYVTGPDGERYMITMITDSNTVLIDNEYAGATVTLTDGACTIRADEHWVDDMGTEYGFDDSGWTIKETAWDADADDLPLIDFDTGAFYFSISATDNWHYHNIDFQNGANGSGLLYNPAGGGTPVLQGCIMTKTHNSTILNSPADAVVVMDRCVIAGSGAGSSQWNYFYGHAVVRNTAIYNMGDSAMVCRPGGHIFFDNVNIGVEQVNGDTDFYIIYGFRATFKNVKIGDGLEDLTKGTPTMPMTYQIHCENWQKVLGAHKIFNGQGTIVKLDVVAGSGDPYKRPGGADSVVELLYDESHTGNFCPSPLAITSQPIFTHEFEATTDNRRYRYYVQAEGAVLASELWMEVEYVNSYDDTSEYTIKKLTSDQAITQRVDASDWSQYLEVLNVNPALASKVRIKIYCSYYHATNKIYIDPLPEVTV